MDDVILERLITAVNTILDPTSSLTDRAAAHSICEECKENKTCHMIGYTLASSGGADQQIKHFGLSLMQHFVNTHWIHSDNESRTQIKNNAISLLMSCNQEESCYVKDGIAHVVTEIAKQVWPQQWPSMVQDLIECAKSGPVQTQLVQLVFLRLAEDVAVLQNISVAHRSKDIRHGLSLSMYDIMSFFYGVLLDNSAKYQQLCGSTNSEEIAERGIHYTLSCSSLAGLQGFVEWINIEHIFIGEGSLINLLCQLLSVDGLKVTSAECLLLIAGRRGKQEEKRMLLRLITPEYTEKMVAAIQTSLENLQDEEQQYTYMKRMSNIFSSLTGLITSSWGIEDNLICELEPYTAFVDILIAFLRHNNPVISSPVAASWNSMLQNREIRKDHALRKCVPVLFETAATRVRRDAATTLPIYAQLDFNDENEMNDFLRSGRCVLVQMLRLCTRCCPIHCVTVCLELLSATLSSPIDNGTDEHGVVRQHCTPSSPSYIHWEAMKTIVDMTLGCAVSAADQLGVKDMLPVSQARELFTSLIQFQLSDVLLYQFYLSTVSSFLTLVELMENKATLVSAIIHLNSDVLRQTVNESIKWQPQVKDLRRHVLSSLIHLCKYHTALVMSMHDDFQSVTADLLALDSGLQPQEKVSVFEALILVSAELKSFQQQSSVIEKIMALSASFWPDKSEPCLASSEQFAKYIGLCFPESEHSSLVRRKISFCISLALGVVYRSRVPEDENVAKEGGFIDAAGFVVHPCAQVVLSFLELIVRFVELFHGLWTPEVRAVVLPEYGKSLEMREGEKTSLVMGNPQAAEMNDTGEKQPWEKMQSFILLNLENCYQILGMAGKCCGSQIYGSPNLMPSFIEKVCSNMHTLPDLRTRTFMRQFLYCFLKFCPDSLCDTVAVPILAKYCRYINQELQVKWNEYTARERQRFNTGMLPTEGQLVSDEENKETEEIMSEQLLRTISREYLEMLVNLCIVKTPQSKKSNPQTLLDGEKQQPDNECQMQDATVIPLHSPNTTQLTTLGVSVLDIGVAEVLLVALASLSWHDTNTVFKAIQLLWPMLKHVFTSMPEMSDDVAGSLFQSILKGLQIHGQHDGCQSQLLALGLFVYVTLQEKHQCLSETLKSIPNASSKAVEDFKKNYKKLSEKKRKMTFKKIVGGIIQQHVGQLFKTEHKMLQLPQILYRSRPPKRPASPELGSVCTLFGGK